MRLDWKTESRYMELVREILNSNRLNQSKARVTIQVSDKIDFKTKNRLWKEGGYSIMIKGQFIREV